MRYTIIIFSLFLYPTLLMSQEKLNNIKAPTSPASSILGLQPTTVLSPKSYQALEASIFSNFLDNYSPVIPNDFALEFTPYWTKNHGLSLEEYLFPKNSFNQINRNSSFSVASTQKFLLGDSTSTNGLAFGYRTTIYFGNKRDREKFENYKVESTRKKRIENMIALKVEDLLDDTNIKNKSDFLLEIKSTILTAIRMYENEEESERLTNRIISDSIMLPQLHKENPDEFLSSFFSLIDETVKGKLLFDEYKAYIKERQGFIMDIAYAGLVNFPSNNFEYSYMPRQSFWITPTYRFEKNKSSYQKVMAVLRYEWYNLDYYRKYFPANTIFKNNIDFGVAISSEFNKFSMQFELVGRKSKTEVSSGTDGLGHDLYYKESKSDLQYIGTFNYNLTDQIVISYNIGNRFDPIQNPDNTIVSGLSVNLGFGAPTRNDIK